MAGEGKEGGSSDPWMSILAVKTSPLSLPRTGSVLIAFFFPLAQGEQLVPSLGWASAGTQDALSYSSSALPGSSSGTIVPETWIYWIRRFLAGHKPSRRWSWINDCKVWCPFKSLNTDHEAEYISAALSLAIIKCSSWSHCQNSKERAELLGPSAAVEFWCSLMLESFLLTPKVTWQAQQTLPVAASDKFE